ncbi:MAG: hypothetical protein IIA44_00805 [Acidobacteria bacterium]|nr:hypothetical protein [Acidobacteriota bacterium]
MAPRGPRLKFSSVQDGPPASGHSRARLLRVGHLRVGPSGTGRFDIRHAVIARRIVLQDDVILHPPHAAETFRPSDHAVPLGLVLRDADTCTGQQQCSAACPYKKAMYRPDTGTSEKCIGCYPRVEGSDPLTNGQPMEPRCMAACVGKIRLHGLVTVEADGTWARDPDHPLYYLVHEEEVALPLYPQFGTQPNIYYIPPRWVPRDYLRQMFGPGVDRAIERYTRPSRRLLATLQLFRVSQEMIFSFDVEEGEKVGEIEVGGETYEIFNDTAIGYGPDGHEIVRVSVEEPMYERPLKLNSI